MSPTQTSVTRTTPHWLLHSQRTALLLTALLFPIGFATAGLALVLLTVLAEAALTRRIPLARSPLDAYLVSFILALLISGIASPHSPTALEATALAVITIYLAFGLLYRHLVTDGAFLRSFLWAWVTGGTAAAVWGIVLYRQTDMAAHTPVLGQNALGTTLLTALLLGLGLFLADGGRWRHAAGLACFPISAGLILTDTQGAWIGAVIGVVSLLALAGRRYAWRALLLLVVIGVLGAAIGRPQYPRLMRGAMSISSLDGNKVRIALARSAFAIFLEHPLVGTGLNTFHLVYPRYRSHDDPTPANQPMPFAHNVFLNMAAEGGALGLGAFAAIIIAAATTGWKGMSAATSPCEKATRAAVLSSFLGLLAHQFFDGTVLSVHLGTGLWFIAAVLCSTPGAADAGRQPIANRGCQT